MMSQVQAIGAAAPQSWDDYDQGCQLTFGGGYRTEPELDIFRHGMGTVFNLLRHEFPQAQLCKAAPQLLSALKLLLTEVHLSGNGSARDFGWAAAVKASEDAIAAAEEKP